MIELALDTEGLIEAALLVLPFIDDVMEDVIDDVIDVMDAAAVRSDSGLSRTGGMTEAPAPGSHLPPSPNNRSIGVAVFLRAYNIVNGKLNDSIMASVPCFFSY